MADNPKEKPTAPTPDDVRLDRLERYYENAMGRVFKILGWFLAFFVVIAGIVVPMATEWQRERSHKTQMEALKNELQSYSDTRTKEAIRQIKEQSEKTLSATKQELLDDINSKTADTRRYLIKGQALQFHKTGDQAIYRKDYCDSLVQYFFAVSNYGLVKNYEAMLVSLKGATNAAKQAVENKQPCPKTYYDLAEKYLSNIRIILAQSNQYDKFSSQLLELDGLMLELKKQVVPDPTPLN